MHLPFAEKETMHLSFAEKETFFLVEEPEI